jgi:hypothetical protein
MNKSRKPPAKLKVKIPAATPNRNAFMDVCINLSFEIDV